MSHSNVKRMGKCTLLFLPTFFLLLSCKKGTCLQAMSDFSKCYLLRGGGKGGRERTEFQCKNYTTSILYFLSETKGGVVSNHYTPLAAIAGQMSAGAEPCLGYMVSLNKSSQQGTIRIPYSSCVDIAFSNPRSGKVQPASFSSTLFLGRGRGRPEGEIEWPSALSGLIHVPSISVLAS